MKPTSSLKSFFFLKSISMLLIHQSIRQVILTGYGVLNPIILKDSISLSASHARVIVCRNCSQGVQLIILKASLLSMGTLLSELCGLTGLNQTKNGNIKSESFLGKTKDELIFETGGRESRQVPCPYGSALDDEGNYRFDECYPER